MHKHHTPLKAFFELNQSMKPTFYKRIFLALLTISIIGVSSQKATAQLNLNFGTNFTQKVGTTPIAGSKYLYTNVATGVDCIITILSLNNGASIASVDDNTLVNGGTLERFQPLITSPATANNTSDVRFSFQLISAGSYNNSTNTGNNVVPSQPLWYRAFDVDGNGAGNNDGAGRRELVEAGGSFTASWVEPTGSNLVSTTSVLSAGDAYIINNSSNAVNGITESPLYQFTGYVVANTVGYWEIRAGVQTFNAPNGTDTRMYSWSFSNLVLAANGSDYGDAPASYNGVSIPAYHALPAVPANNTIFLGSVRPDADTDPSGNATATLDDNNNDDEDCLPFTTFPAYSGTGSYTFNINVTNTSGANSNLYGYIDFNGDGDFNDAGEKSARVIVASAAGVQSKALTFTGFTNITTNTRYARFRISAVDAESASPNGLANTGEVEDFVYNGCTTPTTATTGATQNACGLVSASLGGNTPVFGTGAWAKVSGPGSVTFSTPTTGSSTATVDAAGTYVFSWTITSGNCTSTANITVNYTAAPTTSTTGATQNICGLTSNSLGGNTPTVGTGAWAKVSGPGTVTFSNASSGSSTATVSVAGTYVLSWTITNGTCTSVANITVNYSAIATTATVGATQNICGLISTGLGGNTPAVGTGAWAKVSGPGTVTFSNASSGTSTATVSVAGTYVYSWTITNGNCSTSANITVNYTATPTTATVGAVQNICGLISNALGGNTPAIGTGNWALVSGPGNVIFSNTASGSSSATVDAAGTYVFSWTITNGTCTSSANITVNFTATPSASVVGASQNICGLISNALGGNTPTIGTGAWAKVSGPGTVTFSAGSSGSSTATVSAAGTYVLSWTITNGTCTSSSNITVIYTALPTTATTGADQNLCNTLVSTGLGGNAPSVGTGLWSKVSGPGTVIFNNAANRNSTAAVSIAGTYVYSWTITNGTCTSSDNITVNYNATPTTAAAGTDQAICGLTTAALAANTPTVGTGAWSQFSGPGTTTFGNSASATSSATASVAGTYVYRWTISNGSCTASTDNVTVVYTAAPTTATTGTTQNICGALVSTSLGANTPATGTGAWAKVSGPGTVTFSSTTSGAATATVSATGTYVFSWTITNGTCTSVANITVTYTAAPTTATTGTTQNICGLISNALGGNTPSVGTGAWAKVSGPGNISFSNAGSGSSTATADAAGTYVFSWTITNGTCTSSANVTINYTAIPTAATVGITQNICGLTSNTLGGNTPAIGTGAWAKVSGPGTVTFSNTSSGAATATVSAAGTYVYSWTISNGSCTSSANITVNYTAAPTTATAGATQNICGLLVSASLGGNTPSVGSGAWAKVSGPGTVTFSNATNGSSTATVSVAGTYTFSWTITNGTCTSAAIVTVNYYTTPATPAVTVGGPLTFCNGGSVVLTSSSATGNQWYKDGLLIGGATNQAYTASTAGAYTVVFTNSNGCPSSASAGITVSPYSCITVSGNVWKDANGNAVKDGTPTETNFTSGGIYAMLIDATGKLVESFPVNASGTFVLNNFPASVTGYKVIISTTAGVPGNTAPVISLPSEYVITGEDNNGTAETGIAANASIILPATTGALPNLNFGIESTPNGFDFDADVQDNPGGTNKVSVPAAAFTGTDAEDAPGGYTAGLAGKKVMLTPGTNGKLYYDNIEVTANQTISVFDPTKVSFDPIDGSVVASFGFAIFDAANVSSAISFVTLPFNQPALPAITIGGKVWNDANGTTNNLIDGTGTGTASAIQLYVNLVYNGLVLGSVPVNANGTYLMDDAAGIVANTNFSLVLSTIQGTPGQAVAATLPSGWVHTAQTTGNGDGNSTDGLLNISVGLAIISTGVDFGIEQIPVGAVYTATTLSNPGTTNTVLVPSAAFTGTDGEDGTYSTGLSGRTVRLSPANNGTLFYNGVAVNTATDFINFDPAVVTTDPADGTTTVTFNYQVYDNAGVASIAKAINMPFTLFTVTLQLKVLLQGALIGNTGLNVSLMRDNLRNSPFTGLNYIPDSDPYVNNTSFNSLYRKVGDGLNSSYQTILNTSAMFADRNVTNTSAVDWIFIELRSKTDSTVVLGTRSAIVQQDGTVVDIDGNSCISFPSLFVDKYFVAVRHRNHLGAMTATALSNSYFNCTSVIDFTTMTNADLWNNPALPQYDGLEMATVSDGKRALWAANSNQDLKVKYQGSNNDRVNIQSNVLGYSTNINFDNGFGYRGGDVNMDSKAKYQGSNNDRILLQSIVLGYLLNTLNVNFDFFIQQLP